MIAFYSWLINITEDSLLALDYDLISSLFFPSLVTLSDNSFLTTIKDVVLSMDASNAPVHMGFLVSFFSLLGRLLVLMCV